MTPVSDGALRALLQKVRACRTAPHKGQSIHGAYEVGEGWSISGLTKLLPEIDTALSPVSAERIHIVSHGHTAKMGRPIRFQFECEECGGLGAEHGPIAHKPSCSRGTMNYEGQV